MEKLYAVSKKKRPGDDCTSCQEVFIAEIRLKLKNIGKTTRPFRFDLNQIPYNHVVIDVTNRFKGLDLIDRVPELWMEVHNIVQEAVTKTIPKEKKCNKAKWLSEEVLQIAEKRREGKGQRKRQTN